METRRDTCRDEELDRLLLLLTSCPRPGFEDYYAELSRLELERLRPLSEPEAEGEHG